MKRKKLKERDDLITLIANFIIIIVFLLDILVFETNDSSSWNNPDFPLDKMRNKIWKWFSLLSFISDNNKSI